MALEGVVVTFGTSAPVSATVLVIDVGLILIGSAALLHGSLVYKYIDRSPVDSGGGGGAPNPTSGKTIPDLGNKLEYNFGNATGNTHNIQRSLGLEKKLKKIGILNDEVGRKIVSEHLIEIFNNPTNISRIQDNGRIVKESLLAGPDGFVMLETV